MCPSTSGEQEQTDFSLDTISISTILGNHLED